MRLPPQTDHIVTSIKISIDAPDWFVWDVMLDYPKYPEWNPFTVRVESTLKLGEPVRLFLPDPQNPGKFREVSENITIIDQPRQFTYEMPAQPNVPLSARRDQYIEALGPERCSYVTTDAFYGELAPMALQQEGQWIKDGFDAVARGLKARAEALWQTRAAR
jgi:hypothetical protein